MDTDNALKAWRDEIGRRFFARDFQPLSNEPFRATYTTLLKTGPVLAYRMEMSAGLTTLDEELAKDGEDRYSLFWAHDCHLHASHHGRQVELHPGEATLLHICEPGCVGSGRAFSFKGILFPASAINGKVDHLSDLLARVISKRNEQLRLLKAYLRLLECKSFARLNAEVAEAVSRHIVDLTVLALSESADHSSDGQRNSVHAARLHLALAFLEKHCHDPKLTVATVARHINVSTRALELLFERSGRSYTARLLELRLRKVQDLLQNPDANNLKISDVALRAGFSDLSYFNRRFRQRFGETPTASRGHAAGQCRSLDP